jgi:hypothetical protein
MLELDPKCLTVTPNAILGAGSFATVHGGVYTFPVHGDTPVAVKIFRRTETCMANSGGGGGGAYAAAEATMLAELRVSQTVSMNNPYLVQTYGGLRHLQGLCLVMELLVGCSLRAVLDTDRAVVPLSWGAAIWFLDESFAREGCFTEPHACWY